ncbi:hypothetical protein [Virgibacillus doumboii]|uniref:hypothetical protein n=1 Tax=Virgibacillus doumboii TaxID=2697503 RepID=UPI0013DE8B62|nr:hypothetical protein [Virgibacillus doumboii]
MSNVEVSESSVTNGKATASLIIGVFSIAFVIIPFIGLILGIVGLTLGHSGIRPGVRFVHKG